MRSYLYLGKSNEWPLGRKLMDSSDLSDIVPRRRPIGQQMTLVST